MSHMAVQRRKYLGKLGGSATPASTSSGPKKSTAVAAFVPAKAEDAASGEGSGLKPAKVVTRRSSRQSLAPGDSGSDTPGRTTRSRSKGL